MISNTRATEQFAKHDRASTPELDAVSIGLPLLAMSAGAVHDLGNLIQIASASLNRLARHQAISTSDVLGPVATGGVLALDKAGEMLRRRIHGLERFRPAGTGTDVGTCLRELEMIVGSTWEPGSHRIELRLQPGLYLEGCDRQDFQDALLNLVINARDAMPDGGTIIVEAFALVGGSGPVIRLRVIDHGIGMNEQTLRRAFEPFFTTKGSGLGGVGLPMVRQFVESNGGTIRIESVMTRGTVVTLQLPGFCRTEGHAD